jgi:hypothetical protein
MELDSLFRNSLACTSFCLQLQELGDSNLVKKPFLLFFTEKIRGYFMLGISLYSGLHGIY